MEREPIRLRIYHNFYEIDNNIQTSCSSLTMTGRYYALLPCHSIYHGRSNGEYNLITGFLKYNSLCNYTQIFKEILSYIHFV